MNPKQKEKAEIIWRKLTNQGKSLDKLCEKVQKESEKTGDDDDWDPIPEMLKEASDLLYNCCCILEDVLK